MKRDEKKEATLKTASPPLMLLHSIDPNRQQPPALQRRKPLPRLRLSHFPLTKLHLFTVMHQQLHIYPIQVRIPLRIPLRLQRIINTLSSSISTIERPVPTNPGSSSPIVSIIHSSSKFNSRTSPWWTSWRGRTACVRMEEIQGNQRQVGSPFAHTCGRQQSVAPGGA